jgi:hypothetical protein
MAIVFVLIIVLLPFLYFDYAFPITNGIDYKTYWYADENPPEYVMTSDIKQNRISAIGTAYRRFLMVTSFFVALVIAFASIRLMRKQATQLTSKTRRLLQQYTRLVFVKVCKILKTCSKSHIISGIDARYHCFNSILRSNASEHFKFGRSIPQRSNPLDCYLVPVR